MIRTIEALAAIRSSRFDLPLTYDAGELALQVGDVVRVPLGTREMLAFVVSPPREELNPHKGLRAVIERVAVPRAFDETGLHLAKFIAEQYICTLGEALGAAVLAGAIPRMRDVLVRTVASPNPQRYPSVPPRLVRLIWEELGESFPLDTLLRHPEARRAGDRAALLRFLQALLRSGELRRDRHFEQPKTREYRVRVLEPGDRSIKGKKAEALVAFVREQPGVPRADALLAGFSNAVIARAVKAGALREFDREAAPRGRAERSDRAIAVLADARAASSARNHRPHARRRHVYAEALIHGVTGSGKTYVYVEAIARVLREGGRAIVLVPEISLTPQTARRFEAAFGDRVAVLHSALSERERFEAWQACVRGEIDVVVGARSAVFAPLQGVRLLVVDESHESSYKQDSVPRYHAVAVARERVKREGGVLILGSATPSIESYAAAKAGKLELIEMHERATAQPLPSVRVVDLAKEFEAGNKRVFSSPLVQALGERLERGEKSVLFVNRRGSAGFVLCRSCGHVPECPRCSVSLSVHRAEGLLRCHYCDHQEPLSKLCLSCGLETVKEFGIGTERVAEEVTRLFPGARVMRMDSDTTTRVGDHARILTAFEEDGDVLVGTQMVAKGLDFPTVTAGRASSPRISVCICRISERRNAVSRSSCASLRPQRPFAARRGDRADRTIPIIPPASFSPRSTTTKGLRRSSWRNAKSSAFPPRGACSISASSAVRKR